MKKSIREYYGDYYRKDKAYNEIVALKQTGSVQKYLNNINPLNVHARMTNHHLINIILNSIPSRLHLAMAHYENLRQDPLAWRQKLLEMDIATTEFAQKDQGAKRGHKGKKHAFEDRVQMKGGEATEKKEKKKGEFVPKETWEKRKREGRCMRCGRSNHLIADCEFSPRATTPPL